MYCVYAVLLPRLIHSVSSPIHRERRQRKEKRETSLGLGLVVAHHRRLPFLPFRRSASGRDRPPRSRHTTLRRQSRKRSAFLHTLSLSLSLSFFSLSRPSRHSLSPSPQHMYDLRRVPLLCDQWADELHSHGTFDRRELRQSVRDSPPPSPPYSVSLSLSAFAPLLCSVLISAIC